MNKLDGFETILERVGQAGWAHWVFTLLFAIGLVALLTKNTGMSKHREYFGSVQALESIFSLIHHSTLVSSRRCFLS